MKVHLDVKFCALSKSGIKNIGFYLKIESRPSNNLENEDHCQGHSSISLFISNNFYFKHFFI